MASLFQARHYQAIAQLLQDATVDAKRRGHVPRTIQGIAFDFADMFARDNGRFNRALFMAACEPGANVQARTVDGARKAISGPKKPREPSI